MPFRVTARGPLFAVRSAAIEAEIRSTHEQLGSVVRVAANRAVHRDQGTYERGWRSMRHRIRGAGVIVSSVLENEAPHAGVEENGRKPGHHSPIEPLVAWAERRGFDEKAARRVAFGTEANLFKYGWPNAGSYRGGGYLRPPAPVATALDREASVIHSAYQQLGRRAARRLGA